MIETDVLASVTQFGTAGLVAWMWLVERRAAAERERQLSEAHHRIVEDRVQVGALMDVVKENTRAVGAMEAGQRAILALVDRLGGPAADPDKLTPR